MFVEPHRFGERRGGRGPYHGDHRLHGVLGRVDERYGLEGVLLVRATVRHQLAFKRPELGPAHDEGHLGERAVGLADPDRLRGGMDRPDFTVVHVPGSVLRQGEAERVGDVDSERGHAPHEVARETDEQARTPGEREAAGVEGGAGDVN